MPGAATRNTAPARHRRPTRLVPLALRLLLRDWKAGELRVLALALVVAVAASAAIGFFTERLGRGMLNQSAEFLGADLAVVGPRPAQPDWLNQAGELGLAVSETLEFASVVVHDNGIQLSSVRAVDGQFPLRGGLRTAPAIYQPDQATAGVPAPGEAWAAPRLLQQLGIGVGDSVTVGNLPLRITRVLSFEPGQVGDLFGMSPRLLINLADVPATGVVQPGSRLSYQYFVAGPTAALDSYRAKIKNRLGPSFRLVGVHEGRRAVGTALERAERFLGLAVMAAIVLSGVAIAMAARRYSERHFDMSAMLRCLGASQADLLVLYLLQLLVLGLVASLVGGLLGWAAQWGLLALLADVLPIAPATGSAWPLLAGLATGVLVLTGFALPPVLRLREVPPLRVLRRDLAPLPSQAWLVYGLALLTILLLIWRYTGSLELTAAAVAGATAGVLVLALLALALLALGQGLHGRAGVSWRFGLGRLWRRRRASIGQVLAFGLTLMAMSVIALVRTDLMQTWQDQLPADAPNHFAINILPEQVPALDRFLDDHDVRRSQIYPMVRGRLVSINGEPVRQAVSKEAQNDNALNRELNLTWTDRLQDDNRLLAGGWWTPADHGQPRVSVEQKLARRLGIELGDDLGFSIGDRQLSATVTSLRSVQWDSFRPNFFMVFPPGLLDDLPATYMTSFHLDPEAKPLLVDLVREFPSVTVLELDLLITQVERIFTQVTLAVEYVLLFVLLAGFAVLYAALQTSLDERLYEGALLRALGAGTRQLRSAQLAEFAALGLLAGLVAAAGTESLAWVLYDRVLQFDYHFKWPVWLLAPLAGMLLVGFAGYRGTRPVLKQSPMLLLRDGG